MSPELKRTLQFAIETLMEKELSIIDPNEGGPGAIRSPGKIIGISYCAQEIVQWLDDVYSDMAKATLPHLPIGSAQEKVTARNKIIPGISPSFHHTEKL